MPVGTITTMTSEPTPEATDATSDTATDQPSTGGGHSHAGGTTKPQPLRQGEKRMTLRMPEAYTPSAPTGAGTDDYRCFLLDPELSDDVYLTGTFVKPGNADVVHHVILFTAPPEQVAEAEAMDDAERRVRAGPASAAPGCATTTGSTARPGWARGRPVARSR